MTNLDLIGYNKRFLYAAVGAPGSLRDARLLKELSIFHKILKGDVLPDRGISLGDFGYVPLVTVWDSVFSQFSWQIKGYNDLPLKLPKLSINIQEIKRASYTKFLGVL